MRKRDGRYCKPWLRDALLRVKANLCIKEGTTGVITLEAANDVTEGDDPNAVGLMIACLYENDYQPLPPEITSLLDEHDNDRDTEVVVEAHGTKSTHEATPVDDDQDEMWASSKKGKKAKRKSSALRGKDSTGKELSPAPPTASGKSFLAVHAKVFALGSKYEIPHLQTKSLAKFKAAARLWSKDELIESIPIAFNTAPDNDSLRIAIKAIITANSARLTDDSAFKGAVNGIEGLAFELFRLQTLHRQGQRTCLGCNLVYQSRCAVEGCLNHWGGELHTCDKGDVCVNCRNYA